MVGSGGRTPFVGHFRGSRMCGGVRLSWAGRIAGSADVVEGWEAAEAARDALSSPFGAGSAATLLSVASAALAAIHPRWLSRGDLSVLLVATETDLSYAVGSGLSGIWAPGSAGWRCLAPEGHPLLGEPGVPTCSAQELPTLERWIAVPVGAVFPMGDVATACGVHL
jgi:hypothetical protein